MQTYENDSIEETSGVVNALLKESASSKIMDNELSSNDNAKINGYISRKPRWWKRLAGRRGTAAQRKAINRMTQKGFVLPTLKKYQHELNLAKVFSDSPSSSSKSILADEVLVPKLKDISGALCSDAKNIAEDKHVILEIGFGLGDNILTNATKFPDQYYIGAEIHQPGVGIALMRIEKSIESGKYWMDQSWLYESDKLDIEKREAIQADKDDRPNPYDNLRIFPGDGIKLLDYLPHNSMDSIYLTFPDPWPNEEHHHWRVIQVETVHMIGQVLKNGGCFYLATDSVIVDEWASQIFHIIQKNEDGNDKRSSEWHELTLCPDRTHWLPAMSKYEEKGISEGRLPMCRCWKIKKYETFDAVNAIE